MREQGGTWRGQEGLGAHAEKQDGRRGKTDSLDMPKTSVAPEKVVMLASIWSSWHEWRKNKEKKKEKKKGDVRKI
jgi:hypothetical protein